MADLEAELTSIWSFLHGTASGCASVALWEGMREVALPPVVHLAVYSVTAVVMVHAIHRHRHAVNRKIRAHQIDADAARAEAAVSSLEADGARNSR